MLKKFFAAMLAIIASTTLFADITSIKWNI